MLYCSHSCLSGSLFFYPFVCLYLSVRTWSLQFPRLLLRARSNPFYFTFIWSWQRELREDLDFRRYRPIYIGHSLLQGKVKYSFMTRKLPNALNQSRGSGSQGYILGKILWSSGEIADGEKIQNERVEEKWESGKEIRKTQFFNGHCTFLYDFWY